MLHKSFKPAKCKTSLKLSASRTKLLKNKKETQIKQLRGEVAQLLDSGQVQTARIRVEHVIREEKTMGAYGLIEIYCELIAARLPIIASQKNCPIDLKEAIASVIFASPRCADIPELMDVRKHFLAKYGKDFISASVELRPDCGVNRSMVEKLSAKAPDVAIKLKILTAIAEEHNIKWDPNSFGGNDATSQDDFLKGPSTFEKANRMHEEPLNVHMPYNTQESPSVDIGSHKVANAEPMKNFNASASFGLQNIPPSPEHFSTPANSHLEMKSSGNVVERSEARHRYSGDSNRNYTDRPDWNMEFKDATAAAQAAAESAERASIAARAAAELSSRERGTPYCVPDPHVFRDEQLERPSVQRPPGESPPKSQVNNASISRNSGLAYDHVETSEENLAHYHKSYNPPGKSSSYKSNPDVGTIFHGGPVSRDGTVDRMVSDTYSNPGDHSEDDDSLSVMTKKLHRDAYKKNSNSNEPHVGAAVGDADTIVSELHTVGKYTEINPWSAGLENSDGISTRRSERKNSFGEVNRTCSSEIHDRPDSGESFVEFTHDVQESYGHKKDSGRSSTRSQSSRSSSFTEKQGFPGISNEKAESGLAENLFADYDEERISMGNKASGESSVVFDDYGSDDDVDEFDLDKGPKSSFTISPLPLVEAEQSDNFSILGHERIFVEFSDMSASATHYSQGKHSSIFAETLPGAKEASETEENLPVTFDDSDGSSSDNEDEPEKSSEPRIDDTGYKKPFGSSKFTPVSEAEVVYTSSTQPNILHASESEQEVASNTGSGLTFGGVTGGFRNKSCVPPLYAWNATGKDSWSNQRRDNAGFSPSNLTSSDKAPDEDPDIQYVDDHVKSRPNRRMQRTIPQPKMGSRPVAHAGDDDEEEELVDLDPYYWRKPSTRPAKNDSAEKTRFSSQNSLVSDSDGNKDVPEGHRSPVSSEKSLAGAMAGLSRRTKAVSSSTWQKASRKPTIDSGESVGRKDAKDSGFSPRSTIAGTNSAKPRARTNMPDSSESSSNLKWRSQEAKDKQISGTAEARIVNNQSSVPSSKADTTESSKPAKPSLDSTPREDSFKRASHIHPKMPDYETFLANLKSLRESRQ